jgi:hypothetical protein
VAASTFCSSLPLLLSPLTFCSSPRFALASTFALAFAFALTFAVAFLLSFRSATEESAFVFAFFSCHPSPQAEESASTSA